MRVTVHYMAQIKQAAGCGSETVETPPKITLRDLVRFLADCHGEAFGRLVMDEAEEPRRSLLFFVDDEHADLMRRLKDGDAVTILAPMAGG